MAWGTGCRTACDDCMHMRYYSEALLMRLAYCDSSTWLEEAAVEIGQAVA